MTRRAWVALCVAVLCWALGWQQLQIVRLEHRLDAAQSQADAAIAGAGAAHGWIDQEQQRRGAVLRSNRIREIEI